MRKIFFSMFMILLCLAGCNQVNNHIRLRGTWVEITKKADTIEFTHFGSNKAFHLRRGYIVQSGYRIPKGEIYYYIVLEDDSIALNPITSSICPLPDPDCYPHYFFKLKSRNTFEIGNFFDPALGISEIFTFSKIK